jgi:hypothetical protein
MIKVVTTYVDNTGAPLLDTIMYPDPDDPSGGTMIPMPLAGNVTAVRFMAQDEATGVTDVDTAATLYETSDPATTGKVGYTPDASVIDAEHTRVAWWRLTLTGGGNIDTPEFLWIVQPHGVAATSASQPTGVCQAWASNEDMAQFTPAALDEDYTSWLTEASEILYVLSARQYPGLCSQTVRPQRATCGCWQVLDRGHVVMPTDWQWIGGQWWAESEAFQGYGCGMLYAIRLAGWVRQITQVRIGGAVVDSATYRVDRHEWLVRLTDPATGQNPGWPACQDMSLPDGAAGTFDVTYQWGRTPPIAGVRAAATLAYQLYLADNPRGRGQCKLPAGWTSVARQGITITRSQIQRLSTEGTGIVGIDAFLTSSNPGGLDRPPAVYSRDIMPYAKPVGTAGASFSRSIHDGGPITG